MILGIDPTGVEILNRERSKVLPLALIEKVIYLYKYYNS